ncbi:MAG: 16S rRNA (guanine(527)-N(7))-methyltransferase RsmG [Nitrospiraceae bacterium]
MTDTQQVAVKHFVDSLACSKFIDLRGTHTSLLDIGSGAGFPGLPLKILYPELRVTLLEPNHKKTAFLRYLIGTLGLMHAQAVPMTLEAFSRQTGQQAAYTYVVTRALNLYFTFPHVESLLKEDGRFILCRSTSIPGDVEMGGLTVIQEIFYDLPYAAGKRVLTMLGKSVPRGTSECTSELTTKEKCVADHRYR